MIKKSLVVLVLLLCGCATIDSGGTDIVRKELELQYQALAEANARRDLKAIAAMWSDGFSMIGSDGKARGATEVRSLWQDLFDTSLDPLHFRYTIQALEVREGEAVATIQREVSRMLAIGGELRQVDTIATQRETWIKTEQGWKLRRISDVREIRRLVDGVPSDRAEQAPAPRNGLCRTTRVGRATEPCVILSEAKDHLATLDPRKMILRFAQDDKPSRFTARPTPLNQR